MGYFLAFYPPNSRNKSTFWKNEKNTWRYYHFTYVYQKIWSDDVRFLRYSAWQIWLFFILDHFCPFTPLTTAPKIKILKKWKFFLEILSFYICVPIIMIRWCMVPEIWCATDGWTDRRTDGRKKWHIEVGAPPKKWYKNEAPLK